MRRVYLFFLGMCYQLIYLYVNPGQVERIVMGLDIPSNPFYKCLALLTRRTLNVGARQNDQRLKLPKGILIW